MSLVSIILPTYNRSKFLNSAFRSIVSQTYQDWELIIVDDGSTDESQAIIEKFANSCSNKIKYIVQSNMGPARARNNGIRSAEGSFLAFFDSDDIWLPHHLSSCLKVLDDHTDVDWVYAACQRVEYENGNGNVILPSTFYHNGEPNKLFSLKSRVYGNLHIIEDNRAVEFQITYGIDSGLQNSVMRAGVFSEMLLPDFRIGEDRLFISMALKRGFKLAFIDDINVHYVVHSGNISDTNLSEENVDKRIIVMQQLIGSYKQTFDYIDNLTQKEKNALNHRLADDWFWKLGYSLQWSHGLRQQAINSYLEGIRLAPLRLTFWKTFIKAFLYFQVQKLRK
ncbi:glycosyltransferase family 2 protein [Paraglaciecola psychrophila]|uniref:Glycosyltransferase 2-like domain-containing protein n=1 Tax=Paraglaciecola psychrophila 170 TaxID=1129794 RepID=K7AE72_9ALTE|nr:glycosyltransferase family 2 protein [Paraglaciecola psychrophila]AGH46294.1 hypothetical protein C427_4189 [Paraglaciecola psychrophila 170]GAC40537.1 alpha-1,6-rhamnosyltransferase [Paraglaciecola psychrophila 170]